MAARTQRERISVALSFSCLFFLDLQPRRWHQSHQEITSYLEMPSQTHTEVCFSNLLGTSQSIIRRPLPINLTLKHISLNHNIPPLTSRRISSSHNVKWIQSISKRPHNLNSSNTVQKSKFKIFSETQGKLLAVNSCKIKKSYILSWYNGIF
jgi:hypothetical protein